MWSHQGYSWHKQAYVYPGLLAVIDMEHENAHYTLIKLNQEHVLTPFLSRVWLQWSDYIQFICLNFCAYNSQQWFPGGKRYDYLPV